MSLAELGFDSWCRENYADRCPPGFAIARVARVDRDRYRVRGDGDEVQAEPTGKLLFSADETQDLPSVGDWVVVQYYNEGTLAIIHEVLPRKSHLRRRSSGNIAEYQMIAANIDVAFIVQSLDLNFNIPRLERYLVMLHEGGVEPAILLSKSDLVSDELLAAKIEEIRHAQIATNVLAFSSQTESGLDAVRRALKPAHTYCLLGSSGVGKTTLLNHLLGSDAFETRPVRDKDSRGRHTTARRQLSVLTNGALLIDTPGMRELGLMGGSEVVDESFADIGELAKQCRFRDCSHSIELGCAILKGLETGELSNERYERYIKLRKESAFHEMTYLERRQKDRAFGRMVKSVKKNLRK